MQKGACGSFEHCLDRSDANLLPNESRYPPLRVQKGEEDANIQIAPTELLNASQQSSFLLHG